MQECKKKKAQSYATGDNFSSSPSQFLPQEYSTIALRVLSFGHKNCLLCDIPDRGPSTGLYLVEATFQTVASLSKKNGHHDSKPLDTNREVVRRLQCYYNSSVRDF